MEFDCETVACPRRTAKHNRPLFYITASSSGPAIASPRCGGKAQRSHPGEGLVPRPSARCLVRVLRRLPRLVDGGSKTRPTKCNSSRREALQGSEGSASSLAKGTSRRVETKGSEGTSEETAMRLPKGGRLPEINRNNEKIIIIFHVPRAK